MFKWGIFKKSTSDLLLVFFSRNTGEIWFSSAHNSIKFFLYAHHFYELSVTRVEYRCKEFEQTVYFQSSLFSSNKSFSAVKNSYNRLNRSIISWFSFSFALSGAKSWASFNLSDKIAVTLVFGGPKTLVRVYSNLIQYLNKWARNQQSSCSTFLTFLANGSKFAAWLHCHSRQVG